MRIRSQQGFRATAYELDRIPMDPAAQQYDQMQRENDLFAEAAENHPEQGPGRDLWIRSKQMDMAAKPRALNRCPRVCYKECWDELLVLGRGEADFWNQIFVGKLLTRSISVMFCCVSSIRILQQMLAMIVSDLANIFMLYLERLQISSRFF